MLPPSGVATPDLSHVPSLKGLKPGDLAFAARPPSGGARPHANALHEAAISPHRSRALPASG